MNLVARARASRRISWAPSGWLVRHPVKEITPGTQVLTLACGADFCAVRLGFANITPASYRVEKVVAAPSTTFSDYCNPTGDTEWTTFTFANNGADSDEIVSRKDAPTRVVVKGNHIHPATGEASLPRWTWTDWLPIASLPRSDIKGGPRVLMIRALIEGNQTFTMPNGTFAGYTGVPAFNNGFDYCTGWYPFDVTTEPVAFPASRAHLQVNGTNIACVQFLTRVPGHTCVIAGDSHQQGTSTTTQFANFLFRTVLDIGASHLNKVPVGYWSTAFGGARTSQIFPSFRLALHYARPSVAILPGWTFNDYELTESDPEQQFLSSLMMAAAACDAAGVIPIFLTPFPRDRRSMTTSRVQRWLRLRQELLELRSAGCCVLDASTALGSLEDGVLDGTYLPGLSSDHIHPNDNGHAVLARLLKPVLEECFGLNPHGSM